MMTKLDNHYPSVKNRRFLTAPLTRGAEGEGAGGGVITPPYEGPGVPAKVTAGAQPRPTRGTADRYAALGGKKCRDTAPAVSEDTRGRVSLQGFPAGGHNDTRGGR